MQSAAKGVAPGRRLSVSRDDLDELGTHEPGNEVVILASFIMSVNSTTRRSVEAMPDAKLHRNCNFICRAMLGR